MDSKQEQEIISAMLKQQTKAIKELSRQFAAMYGGGGKPGAGVKSKTDLAAMVFPLIQSTNYSARFLFSVDPQHYITQFTIRHRTVGTHIYRLYTIPDHDYNNPNIPIIFLIDDFVPESDTTYATYSWKIENKKSTLEFFSTSRIFYTKYKYKDKEPEEVKKEKLCPGHCSPRLIIRHCYKAIKALNEEKINVSLRKQ